MFKVTVNCLVYAPTRNSKCMAILDRTRNEFDTSVFAHSSDYQTVYKVCSNSTTIWTGPHVSIFYVARSRRELWRLLCTKVRLRASETKFVGSQEKTRLCWTKNASCGPQGR